MLQHQPNSHNDSSEYEGSWVASVQQGKGRYVYHNGDVYVGEFKEGKRSGLGKYVVKADGQVYEGTYLNGQPEGKGKLVMGNKDRYEGDFKNGLADGYGIGEYTTGKRYEGEWKDDC